MTKNTIHSIIFTATFFMVFAGGLVLGRYTIKKPVFISDRITACELKGGHYSYIYSDIFYPPRSYEKCEISAQEIKDF